MLDREADRLGLPVADPVRGGAASSGWSTAASADAAEAQHGPSRFQRFLLPGLAFKAVVIGGGYATGRELAEFFLPQRPARRVARDAGRDAAVQPRLHRHLRRAGDRRARLSRASSSALLGPVWIVFEAVYILFVILILAVYGAAAGEIAAAFSGRRAGPGLALMAASSVRRRSATGRSSDCSLMSPTALRRLCLVRGARLPEVRRPDPGRLRARCAGPGWALGGADLCRLNLIGAVVILPVVRHLTSSRDAIIAGAIAGPLAMLPGLLFFTAMVAFYPEIANATLPSDYLLQRMRLPAFYLLFQADDLRGPAGKRGERGPRDQRADRQGLAAAPRQELSPRARFAIALLLLAGCMLLAGPLRPRRPDRGRLSRARLDHARCLHPAARHDRRRAASERTAIRTPH